MAWISSPVFSSLYLCPRHLLHSLWRSLPRRLTESVTAQSRHRRPPTRSRTSPGNPENPENWQVCQVQQLWEVPEVRQIQQEVQVQQEEAFYSFLIIFVLVWFQFRLWLELIKVFRPRIASKGSEAVILTFQYFPRS